MTVSRISLVCWTVFAVMSVAFLPLAAVIDGVTALPRGVRLPLAIAVVEVAERVETGEGRLLVRQSFRTQRCRDLVVEHECPSGSVEQSVDGRRVEADPHRVGAAGLQLFAQHHIKEGMTACVDYIDNQNKWASQDRIDGSRRFLAARFPLLANAPLLETRACHYESSVNGNFIIDHVPGTSNAWIAGVGQAEGLGRPRRQVADP